jgi:hypothetical protein
MATRRQTLRQAVSSWVVTERQRCGTERPQGDLELHAEHLERLLLGEIMDKRRDAIPHGNYGIFCSYDS